MKCVKGVCDRNKSHFNIEKENIYDPCVNEIGKLNKLFNYFMYKAPNINSELSPCIAKEYHNKILKEMLKDNKNFIFCQQNVDIDKECSKVALNGQRICVRCKRFVCKRSTRHFKRDEERVETNLECLLRHIRNSIAHGHIYVRHGGNYISVFLEDQNSKKNITSRIVCCQADLDKWKKILEKYVREI